MPDGSIAHVKAIELPESFDQQVQSWDMAFKDLTTSDYTRICYSKNGLLQSR